MITTINEYKKHLMVESYFKNEEYYINKAIDRYGSDTYLEEIYKFEYPDNDITEDSEHYNEFIYDFFSSNIENVFDDVYYTLEHEPLVYRSITVSEDWTIENLKDKNIGIYWSYDRDKAEPHWGYNKNKKEILIIGEIIYDDSVNIDETILLNLAPGLGEEEKEIRLIKDKLILVKGVEIDGEFIEINEEYRI